jgi:hypothetical protein
MPEPQCRDALTPTEGPCVIDHSTWQRECDLGRKRASLAPRRRAGTGVRYLAALPRTFATMKNPH